MLAKLFKPSLAILPGNILHRIAFTLELARILTAADCHPQLLRDLRIGHPVTLRQRH